MSKQQLNDLDFQNVARILNLLDPTALQHPATKNYVDNLFAPKRVLTRLTNNSNVTLTNITNLSYVLTAGGIYYYESQFIFQSVAATTGLVLTLAVPTGTVSGLVGLLVAADGTASGFHGNISASGDVVIGSGVQTTNTNTPAFIRAIIAPTVAGNVTPQFRSENNGSQVSIEVNSFARLMRIA